MTKKEFNQKSEQFGSNIRVIASRKEGNYSYKIMWIYNGFAGEHTRRFEGKTQSEALSNAFNQLIEN
jgi:hypothetical protein